jgi:hypothetical protein
MLMPLHRLSFLIATLARDTPSERPPGLHLLINTLSPTPNRVYAHYSIFLLSKQFPLDERCEKLCEHEKISAMMVPQ